MLAVSRFTASPPKAKSPTFLPGTSFQRNHSWMVTMIWGSYAFATRVLAHAKHWCNLRTYRNRQSPNIWVHHQASTEWRRTVRGVALLMSPNGALRRPDRQAEDGNDTFRRFSQANRPRTKTTIWQQSLTAAAISPIMSYHVAAACHTTPLAHCGCHVCNGGQISTPRLRSRQEGVNMSNAGAAGTGCMAGRCAPSLKKGKRMQVLSPATAMMLRQHVVLCGKHFFPCWRAANRMVMMVSALPRIAVE